jgi:hypothetical protein
VRCSTQQLNGGSEVDCGANAFRHQKIEAR